MEKMKQRSAGGRGVYLNPLSSERVERAKGDESSTRSHVAAARLSKASI